MRSIYILVLFSFFCTLGCIKDKSVTNVYDVAEVAIDTTGLKADYTVFQNDVLEVAPNITLGGKSSDKLTYEWTINAYGGYKRDLGDESELSALITEIPSPTPYTLILIATDPSNNTKAFFSWPIKVISPFGAGLIVADNTDGQNTDIHVIAAYNFTSSIYDDETEPKVIQNAYSKANGSLINGIVKDVQFAQRYDIKDITFVTENSLIRVDPNSYLKTMENNELFVIAPKRIATSSISTVNAINPHQYLVNDGRLYGRNTDGGYFIYPYLSADDLDYKATKVCGLQRPSIFMRGGVIYDELNNRFMLIPGVIGVTAGHPLLPFPTTGSSSAFNPQNMGNKTCIELFEGYDSRIVAIMKERTEDKYYAYQIKITDPTTGNMGIIQNNLSNLTDIKQAKYFTNSTSEQILFYGTDTKVYTSSLESGASQNASLRYTCQAGEKITGMKMYTGIGSSGFINLPSTSDPTDWEKRVQMAAANRMLILSTYNESTKEGKIITIPIETLGTGGLVKDPKYITTYGGFGYITAFDAQL